VLISSYNDFIEESKATIYLISEMTSVSSGTLKPTISYLRA